MLEIPPERLPDDTLQALLEEYINREGTDYGFDERSLDSKVAQLKRQIKDGKVVICFDAESESCTLLTRREFQQAVQLSE